MSGLLEHGLGPFFARDSGGQSGTVKIAHMTTKRVPALIGSAVLALALIGCGVESDQRAKRPPKE
jgi:hypothetical protein